MKPNKRNFLKSYFPALIIVPAMIYGAHAAPIPVDAAGNVTVPGNYDELNGGSAHTVTASGGTAPLKTVTIETGAILTGDPVPQSAVRVTAAGYTVNNAGAISGNLRGIDSAGFAISVDNSGSIRGLTNEGIVTNGGGTITNRSGATIQGTTLGVSFLSAGGSVGNYGTITGQTGIGTGPFAATINNYSVITGTAQDGVNTGGGSVVSNYSQLTGATNGVNFTTAGGNLTNTGTITGTSDSGVRAVSGLLLSSNNTITGVTGVTVTGGGSSILNSGVITGTAGTAVSLGNTAGVGGNSITLSDAGTLNGNATATGTGNTITASQGHIFGNVSGFQTINVTADGLLQVEGNIAGSSVINAAPGSQLIGAGVWTSTINLEAGSSIYGATQSGFGDSGVLAINGNVNHAAGSFINLGINPELAIANNGTNSTVLQSGGGTYNATNATVDLGTTSNSAIRNGGYEIIQNTGGTVLGGANAVTYFALTDTVLGNYFSSTALNTDGDLVLTVDHNYENLPGLTSNQSSLGGALDAFMDTESGLASGVSNDLAFRYLIGNLDISNLSEVQGVLNAIVSPIESSLGLTESVVNSNYRLHRQIQNHLSGARNESEETTTRTSGAPTRDSKGGLIAGESVVEYSGGEKGNVWGTFSADSQDYEGFGDSSEFDGDVGAFTAGIDYRVAPNVILGLLVDGSKSELDTAFGDQEIESIRGALYGSFGGSLGIYSDFLVGYGEHDLDYTDAQSLQAMLTVGYAMGDERVKHGPFLGAEYQKVEVDGFGYTGFVPIEVDDYDVKSLRGLVGYRVDADLGRFKPYASIAYAHEFEDGQSDAKAFIGNTPFHVKGAERGSAILIAAGTGIGLTSHLDLDLGYRGELAIEDEGLDSHGGTVGLNYKF